MGGMEHAGGLGEVPDDEGVVPDPVEAEVAGEVFGESDFLFTERKFFDCLSLVVGEGRGGGKLLLSGAGGDESDERDG